MVEIPRPTTKMIGGGIWSGGRVHYYIDKELLLATDGVFYTSSSDHSLQFWRFEGDINKEKKVPLGTLSTQGCSLDPVGKIKFLEEKGHELNTPFLSPDGEIVLR